MYLGLFFVLKKTSQNLGPKERNKGFYEVSFFLAIFPIKMKCTKVHRKNIL